MTEAGRIFGSPAPYTRSNSAKHDRGSIGENTSTHTGSGSMDGHTRTAGSGTLSSLAGPGTHSAGLGQSPRRSRARKTGDKSIREGDEEEEETEVRGPSARKSGRLSLKMMMNQDGGSSTPVAGYGMAFQNRDASGGEHGADVSSLWK